MCDSCRRTNPKHGESFYFSSSRASILRGAAVMVRCERSEPRTTAAHLRMTRSCADRRRRVRPVLGNLQSAIATRWTSANSQSRIRIGQKRCYLLHSSAFSPSFRLAHGPPRTGRQGRCFRDFAGGHPLLIQFPKRAFKPLNRKPERGSWALHEPAPTRRRLAAEPRFRGLHAFAFDFPNLLQLMLPKRCGNRRRHLQAGAAIWSNAILSRGHLKFTLTPFLYFDASGGKR